MRAPPPEPTLISTMPCASSVRSASRATMRLTPKRSARSFSVPRKSPGRSSLANSASRTWATIWVERVGLRNATTLRPNGLRSLLRIAGMRLMGRLGRQGKISKMISFKPVGGKAPQPSFRDGPKGRARNR